MATIVKPVKGRCARCKQPRDLFEYKPLHDCIDAAGTVSLPEAARLIAEIEDQGDRWCSARIDGTRRLLCVPCCDCEVVDEERHIEEYEL